jgi:hypothetical protein
MGAVPDDRIEKMIRAKAFPGQPPEEVRERDNDGVDLAGADLLLELE